MWLLQVSYVTKSFNTELLYHISHSCMWSLDIMEYVYSTKVFTASSGTSTDIIIATVQGWFIEYIYLAGHIIYIYINCINSDKYFPWNDVRAHTAA